VNKDILDEKLGLAPGTVPEEFVIVAKHLVMGITEEQVADTLGVEVSVIHEVMGDKLFQEIKGFLGAIYAQDHVNQTAGWDALEQLALGRLIERVKKQQGGDPDFLLRVAAVANKANRRTQQQENVMDPQKVGYTTITLSSRFMRKLNPKTGEETETQEKTLSIKDGSMVNPKFEDINQLLNVRNKGIPYLDPAQAIKVSTHEPTIEEIADNILQAGRKVG
jgi:hypothetical protein